MKKQLKIRDITLRDGQQSQFATRMTQKQIDKVLPLYKDAGFYAMEVWGGAIPDSVMRYLNENPWNRLEKIKTEIGNNSKLTALSRGRNLFGYNPYPDEIIEGFCKNSIESGLDIMRIFDALNDIDNMKSTIDFVQKYKGKVDCAICFTVDPKFQKIDKFKSFIKGKKLPQDIFNLDYYLNKALQLEDLGADIITIKDMAGLLHPEFAYKLINLLKSKISVPLNLHVHCTPGYGLATTLVSMLNEIDIIDTVIMNFAGGSAGPAFELVHLFANKLNLETGVNIEVVSKINHELIDIQTELQEFDKRETTPLNFNIFKDAIPDTINNLFDQAIVHAKEKHFDDLLSCIHKIENYFNFPEPNEAVKNAEIPGGMYSNLLAQLETLKLGHLLDKVLKYVPKVRLDSGCPPLVTPTSQIVGGQAVNCVVDESKDKEPFYTTISKQFTNLVKGSYGKTPTEIDPEFRKYITGNEKEIPYDTTEYQKQPNPIFEELGGVKLAKNEKEVLLLELFPTVAKPFLKTIREKEFNDNMEKYRDEEQNDEFNQLQGAIE